MKYLKLITEPPLSDDKHITFAYFGKVEINKTQLIEHLKKINQFFLNNPRTDKFGENNDIPCVVYEYTDSDSINKNRKEMLLGLKVESQNRINSDWAPHISNVNIENVKDSYKIIGIQSNDKLFGIYF